MQLNKLEVKFISATVVDVFTGAGWDNWTRFEIKRLKGKVFPKKLQGASLDSNEFKSLCSSLENTFHSEEEING